MKIKKKPLQRLEEDFIFDYPFYTSKRSGLRYLKAEALIIIELRTWGEGNSSYLNDLDNAQWTVKQEEDYKLNEW